MLHRLPAWSIRSTSNRAASSRRRIIIIAIIAVLLAAIIAVPIIMALLAQPITVVIITIIGVLTMAVFIIAIIVVLLAVLIAGVIITETVGVALGWSRAHTRGQSLSTMNQSPAHRGFFLGAAKRDDRRSPQASADPFRGAAWFARHRTFPLIV